MHRILISRLLNSCILSLPRFLLHILLSLLLPCSLLVSIYIDCIILIIEISGQPGLITMEWDTDRMGSDYSDFDLNAGNPAICRDACMKDPQCKACTYVKPNTIQGPNPRCWLKNNVPNPTKSGCCVSGIR
jgi:hypothetical protein